MIVFDIETGPLGEHRLRELCPPFNPEDVKVGNLKDPDKIAEKIEECRANHYEKFAKRAALNGCTGRVLAVGLMDWQSNNIITMFDHQEEAILQFFWSRVRTARDSGVRMIGHNIYRFDLPFLVTRSWILGVPVPEGVRVGRYWNADIFADTYEIASFGQPFAENCSLDFIARAFGLEGKPRATVCIDGEQVEVSGENFSRLWFHSVETRKVALAYLESDLKITSGVAAVMGLLPAIEED